MENLQTPPRQSKRKLEIPQAIEHYPGLTPSTRRVYAALLSHCRPGRLYCWPSLDTISQTAGCTVRTVSRALDALEERGLLSRLPVYEHGRRQGTVYRLKDLSPLLPYFSPAQTPRRYIPGEPARQAAELSTIEMSKKPFPTPKGNPVRGNPIPLFRPGPEQGMGTATRTARMPQERRTPRQTGKQTYRPQTPAEAAAWCLAWDKGYTETQANKRRLVSMAARFGLEALRRLVDAACAVHVHEPGAYLQHLLTRKLAATG